MSTAPTTSRLDRDVAVKTLKGPFTERFEREAPRDLGAEPSEHLHALTTSASTRAAATW